LIKLFDELANFLFWIVGLSHICEQCQDSLNHGFTGLFNKKSSEASGGFYFLMQRANFVIQIVTYVCVSICPLRIVIKSSNKSTDKHAQWN